MIVKETTNNQNQFKPVTIEFTFESQKELNFFGSLFNWTPIIDYMDKQDFDINSDTILQLFEYVGANVNNVKKMQDYVLLHPAVHNPSLLKRINK